MRLDDTSVPHLILFFVAVFLRVLECWVTNTVLSGPCPGQDQKPIRDI